MTPRHPQPAPAPLAPCPFRTAAPILALLIGLTTAGCFRPSSHIQALRDHLIQATGETWAKEFELGVGNLSFGLARAGITFLDLPPEARIALRSVRGADVGVYHLHNPSRSVATAPLLQAADQAMNEKRWDRVVAVIEGTSHLVAIYVPQTLPSTKRLNFCVVVVDGPQMVIASARGNPEPLLAMALEQARAELDLPRR
jgi:hypothetical protein